jgi:methionyl-tRNA synthetase
MEEPVREWLGGKNNWPASVLGIANAWLKDGIQDRCITRDLEWGVKVPRPGYEGKVFYVWFDAPIGYLAATKEWSDLDPTHRDWLSWWKGGEDVHYAQFMAKDNVPFHTVSFPATLLGTGEGWKTADYIKGFNWLTYYGGKFSTSQHRGIFMDEALKLYPVDYWRYSLLTQAPEASDSDFSWEGFATAVNKDMADLLGNQYQRVFTLTQKYFSAEVPSADKATESEDTLTSCLEQSFQDYEQAMDSMQFRKATQSLRELWKIGNEYLEQTAPWKTAKTDLNRTGAILNTAVNLLRFYSIVSAPIIPSIADQISTALGLTDQEKQWPTTIKETLWAIKDHRSIKPTGILVNKIKDEEIVALRAKYGDESTSLEAGKGKEFNLSAQTVQEMLQKKMRVDNDLGM